MTVPDVSVVMAAYNSARYIDAALESLQLQTSANIEILVVIDARSSDGTFDIVAARASGDARIQPIHFDRPGLFPAFNAGIEGARAPFISFLDSDDLCPPGRISRQLDKLSASPPLGAIVGEVLIFEALDADLTPAAGTRWARVLGPCLGAGTFRRDAVEFDWTL